MTNRASSGWTIRLLLGLTLLPLSQACYDDPAEPPAVPEPATQEPASIPDQELVEDPYLLDLAREIPGFGGLYVESGGDRVVITMTEAHAADFPAARQVVSATHAASDGTPPVEFIERVVQFSFIDLARHRTRLGPRLIGIPGVESLHVDEESNRIAIGLSDLSIAATIQDMANELAIPLEMVSFWETHSLVWETSPYAPRSMADEVPFQDHPESHTILDRVPDNMLVGGYEVRAEGNGACTLGFTALRIPSAEKVFVSASHCSKRMYDLDDGPWFQPKDSTASAVGFEIVDPSNCPEAERCRAADATMIGVNTAVADIALGKIARLVREVDCRRPGYHCGDALTNPNLTVYQYAPTIPVTSVGWHTGRSGERLSKVGRTTGWTTGPIKDTCVMWTGVGLECTIMIDYLSGGGDSGSPVFQYRGIEDAELRGIHVGRTDPREYHGWAVAVRIERIVDDLGAMWMLPDPGVVTVNIIGPEYVRRDAECTWEANASGVDPITYTWSGVLSGNEREITGVVEDSGILRVSVTDGLARSAQDSSWIHVGSLESCMEGPH